MIIDEQWSSHDGSKWSGEQREEKWFPNSIQKHRICKIVGSNETTSVYFDIHKDTGQVYRISNEGLAPGRKIVVKLTHPDWEVVYTIGVDVDGENHSIIDLPVNVPDFKLIKQGDTWVISDEIKVDVSDVPV